MDRMRFITTAPRLSWLLLLGMSPMASAADNFEKIFGDVNKIANHGVAPAGRTSCPKADNLTSDSSSTLKRISGALEMADQMPSASAPDTPERASVNKFCENVQSRFPSDKLLSVTCENYIGAVGSRTSNAITYRDDTRTDLFKQINRRPKAQEFLVADLRSTLDAQYKRCMRAQGASAPALGQMKAQADDKASYQTREGKVIESNVRYGSETSGRTGSGGGVGGDAR